MRRSRKYDLYIIAFLAFVLAGYFIYNRVSSEDRGINYYFEALQHYKDADYEHAYQIFGKVPSASSLKEPALFRQARCANNLDKQELAIKKYNKIVKSHSKSSIVPISRYNMACMLFNKNDPAAGKHFRQIIKKYPTSDYAIASEYYLGLIDVKNMPPKGRRRAKVQTDALNHFLVYIQKSPDGRYALKSVQEIAKLSVKLKNYDNLLISRVYYSAGDYATARKYLDKTTIAESWTDFARAEYKLGHKDKAKYYTEFGLKDHADAFETNNVIDVIDNYIAAFPTRKEGITALNSKNYKSVGADYISYLYCSEVVPANSKDTCFKKMYEKYPNGQFSADALYNLFLTKYLQRKYYDAQRLGLLHLKKFPNVKSAPAVTYYMGRIANKLKHYESANNYYKQVITKYPDSYYALRANYQLYKADGAFPFLDLNVKPVLFPYKKSLDKNLVIKLASLKDYDLVEELCKKDKFVQSWIAYQKGDYTISAILARNAMDEMLVKPPMSDLRWRLIYPLHYYNLVSKFKGNNNPIILQSIIKEESHFNPYAHSSVGASGLMQIMDATYAEILKNNGFSGDIYNTEKNIRAGSIYYSNLKKVLGNKDLYAITAYNGGMGSVTSWFTKIIYKDSDEFIEQIPYPETKNYVKKVLRTYWMYGNIY